MAKRKTYDGKVGMLVPGNGKLGYRKGIWTFDLPPICTCPGSNNLCRSMCYASWYSNGIESVRARQIRNYRRSQRSNFVDRMCKKLEQLEAANTKCKDLIVRVHSVGDFYDVGYTMKWAYIAEAHPNVTVYAYTRSWMVDGLISPLRLFASLTNVQLLLSCDCLSTWPDEKLWGGYKLAYLSTGPDDFPDRPCIVFRDKWDRKVVARTLGSGFVCRHEDGTKGSKDVTCVKCKVCFDDEKWDRAISKCKGREA